MLTILLLLAAYVVAEEPPPMLYDADTARVRIVPGGYVVERKDGTRARWSSYAGGAMLVRRDGSSAQWSRDSLGNWRGGDGEWSRYASGYVLRTNGVGAASLSKSTAHVRVMDASGRTVNVAPLPRR